MLGRTRMKAILCRQPGGPDDLTLEDIPDPEAGPGEVVVKVAAAGLNFFDTLIIAGKYQIKPAFPFSPAAEFAGVVESIGRRRQAVKAGDRVMGYQGYGCARERIAVKAEKLVKVPDNLDFDRAAGLSVTYGTTIHALKDRGKLKAGETLAVLGAAGGIGLAAIEIGKLMGARVIACASSDEKCAFAKQHGADETINYATADLQDALKERDRRTRRRCHLRSGRRRLCRKRVARDRLEGALSGGRIRGRRDSEDSAQSRAAERLRHRRRLLGRLHRARTGGAGRQHDADRRLVRGRENSHRMCMRSIRSPTPRGRSRTSRRARSWARRF